MTTCQKNKGRVEMEIKTEFLVSFHLNQDNKKKSERDGEKKKKKN